MIAKELQHKNPRYLSRRVISHGQHLVLTNHTAPRQNNNKKPSGSFIYHHRHDTKMFFHELGLLPTFFGENY